MGKLESKTKEEIEHLLGELQRIRDQVRLKLHLAGMEVKTNFAKIEPEIFEIEERAKHFTEEAAGQIKTKLTDLRDRLNHLRDRAANN